MPAVATAQAPGTVRSWGGYIATIAEGLLTLEINTVEKACMSAQKMPELPIALHNIVETYQAYLKSQGVVVDQDLYDAASARLANLQSAAPKPDETFVEALREGWQPSGKALAELDNGPATFEALQWAAFAGLQKLKDSPDQFSPEVQGVLSRIRANSRQLREVAIILARDNSTGDGQEALFGSTMEKTLAALFRHPRPQLKADPDVMVLVRKVWDIGTETVLMQTSVQVDGDLVLRVSPGLAEVKRKFFFDLHTGCVQTGVNQWQGLFRVLGDLLGQLGRDIFGAAARVP